MEYQFLILPFIAVFITQIIKFALKSNKLKITWRNLIAYSGMPSGHATMTISLTTIIGLELGITNPLFAVCLFFALLVIRDATGLRQYIGKHGEVINELVEDLDEDEMLDDKYPKLLEKIGHTFLQVLVGSIIGFTVSFVGWLLIN